MAHLGIENKNNTRVKMRLISTEQVPGMLLTGKLYRFIILIVFLFAQLGAAYSQTVITGLVADSLFRKGISGALVEDVYSNNTAYTSSNGTFHMEVPSQANLEIRFSHPGFKSNTVPIVTSSRKQDMGEVLLSSQDMNSRKIYQFADQSDWLSPVTFSNQESSLERNHSELLPLPYHLRNTPGIFTSTLGGSTGEIRLNLRGFDQRQIGVMINGIPLNQMESNSFSWSGHDGLGDFISSIQVQKGMNYSSQYTPFAAGMLNMITSPASMHAGGSVKYSYGAGNFMHAVVVAHSGLIQDKFAMSVGGMHKFGTGMIKGTWTDAWTYYFNAAWRLNSKQRLELFALGSPQQHGQNTSMQNPAAYSHLYATELGIHDEVLDEIPISRDGRLYSQDVSRSDPEYNAKQFWNGKFHERHTRDIMNEHENYSHKPLAQLNWFADWSGRIRQQTMVYYSGILEGNSGVYGDVNMDFTGPSAFIDYNSTIAENRVKTASEGILSNTLWDQSTIGATSRLEINLADRFSSSLGIDWSSSNIEHYQEIRDLLGGSYFIYTGNQFEAADDYEKLAGDRIGFNQKARTGRIGFSGQVNYNGERLRIFANAAYAMVNYSVANHFRRDPDFPGLVRKEEVSNLNGYQAKGGISYRIFNDLMIFANYQHTSRLPAISILLESDMDKALPANELTDGLEAGIRYAHGRIAEVQLNAYRYLIFNSTLLQKITSEIGNVSWLYITGMDQQHMGLELETTVRPFRFVSASGYASLGQWTYINVAAGTLTEANNPEDPGTNPSFNIYGHEAGNAPHLQLGMDLSIQPLLHSYIAASFRYHARQYAAWNPVSSIDVGTGSFWELPAYYLLDLHAGYTIYLNKRFRIEITGHVYNLLDEYYIQDALNNGSSLGYFGENNEFLNTAAASEVFLGLPRTYSAGIKISF